MICLVVLKKKVFNQLTLRLTGEHNLKQGKNVKLQFLPKHSFYINRFLITDDSHAGLK